MRAWLLRYQEVVGWAPLAVGLVLLSWVALGHMAQRYDELRWLIELPIVAAHGALAAGFAHFTWRRWRQKLNDEQKSKLWAGVMGGHLGPMVAYGTNAAMRFGCLVLWLWFFWPRR